MTIDVLLDLTPLDTTSRYRGIGTYATQLGRAIDALSSSEREGLSIAALTALDGASPSGPLTWSGGAVEATERAKTPWVWRRRLRLGSTLRRVGPRLFHAVEGQGTPIASTTPRVVTCHDLLELVLSDEYFPGRPLARWGQRVVETARYGRARRVIAISAHTADDLARILGVAHSRIDVVPQGVDHARFRPPASDDERREAGRRRASFGLEAGSYFVYVGGADPRKSVDVLIAAFARAALGGASLVLAGRASPADDALIVRALAQAGNPAGVRRLGYVTDDDVRALLGGAIALAFPSTYEGFGLPVLEAMACGCPVITTRASSLVEVAGDAASYVPPRDAVALAAAMTALARDGALAADLARAGIVQAARFSWRATALGTVASYVRALREG